MEQELAAEELPQEVDTEVTQETEVEVKEELTEEPQQSRSQNAKQRLRRKLREEQQARLEAEERTRQLESKFTTIEQKLDTVINPPPQRPSRVDFETEESYEDALFEWRDHRKTPSPASEPKFAGQGQPPQRQEVPDPVDTNVRKNWESQMEDAADKYEDFDEKIISIPRESMTEAMTFAIMESDKGGEIAYFLGDNHAEAARIARLPLASQVREIDNIASRFKPKQTSAPDPISPTKGGDSSGITDPSKMSPEQYRDYRRKQGMPH